MSEIQHLICVLSSNVNQIWVYDICISHSDGLGVVVGYSRSSKAIRYVSAVILFLLLSYFTFFMEQVSGKFQVTVR